MKVLIFFCSILVLTVSIMAAQPSLSKIDAAIGNITGFSTCCAKFAINDKILFTDPWHIPAKEKADIILLSHDHEDHYSYSNMKKLVTSETVIVAPASFAERVKKNFPVNVISVKPGDKVNVKGLELSAIASYSTNLHPKENGYTGYIFNMDGAVAYFAGETQVIPEMDTIKADIALLPIDTRASMSTEEAAAIAIKMNVKAVIPTHYTSEDDVAEFSELVKDRIKVVNKNMLWMYP